MRASRQAKPLEIPLAYGLPSLFRALDDLLAGGPSGALNLANSRGHSVMEVIQAAERVYATNRSALISRYGGWAIRP
jgi:hypothetical protein